MFKKVELVLITRQEIVVLPKAKPTITKVYMWLLE
jgi:hypothetical protein